MKFENAYKGVSKLLTAEVMILISGIVTVVSTVVTLVLAMANLGDAAAVLLLVTGVLVAATAVLGVIAFILNLVGLIQARKDEASFMAALVVTLIGIAASACMGIFSQNTLVSGLLNVVFTVAQLATTLFVIQGIMKLANRLGNAAMVQKGNTMFKLILTVQLVAIIASFISVVFKNNSAMLIIAGVLSIAGAVVNIVAYFLYLSYLAKAKKMLA